MVDRTNVNDASFPNDWYRNSDVARDVNASDQAIRDVMLDIYGRIFAYIFSGLTVEDGSRTDTFKILAGRARDAANKRYIVVPSDVDNEPCVDATGAWNYVAVRHIWEYSGPRPPYKTLGPAYNAVRADAYEINVQAPPAHVEAAGWVRLARARKVAGVWEYDHEFTLGVANYGRSRWQPLPGWSIDFSYLGAPPGIVLMDRHTLAAVDLWRVPWDFLVARVEIDARLAGAADVAVNLMQNGVIHPNWPAGTELVLAAGAVNEIWYSFTGETVDGYVQYYKDDLIQVQLAPGVGAPTDISVIVSGYITGNV